MTTTFAVLETFLMPDSTSTPVAVAATRRVADWLTHMGVSRYAFDDTLGLISPLLTVHRLHAKVVSKVQETPSACTVILQAGAAFAGVKPGQFVMIGVEINGVRHRRAYSPRSVKATPAALPSRYSASLVARCPTMCTTPSRQAT
jgi:stearoyl-CoA 9-desaturase NADPH oxidoreductase